MPELPEVETTLRGIAPHIEGKTVEAVVLRQLSCAGRSIPIWGRFCPVGRFCPAAGVPNI